MGCDLIELENGPYILPNRAQCRFSDCNFKQVISWFYSHSYKRVKNEDETKRTF